MKKYAAVGSAMLLLAVAAALPLYAADVATSTSPKGFQAITKPSKDVTVSFVHPGRILQVLAAKGDEVKEGQLLAQQDDSEEQAAKESDRLAAESVVQIEAEKAIRDQKLVDQKKYEQYGSEFEKENAILEVKIEEAKIKVAELQHDQAIAKYKQSSVLVEKYKVMAPISGLIADEFLKAGESAEGGNTKLVRIVQLDPLWVEVPVPMTVARKLNKGDAANVTFTDGKDRPGKVAVISPTGDAPSETILVRLEVANPQKISSGENVFVSFPVPSGGVARP
jgi:RND family efflux transporter MFP subunit